MANFVCERVLLVAYFHIFSEKYVGASPPRGFNAHGCAIGI